MTIHIPLLISLVSASVWTILFSMSINPGIRGYRNFGILACYICPVVFLFSAGWKLVGATWLVFALFGGVTYTIWEMIQRARASGPEKPSIGFTHAFPGILMWPIMLPEAMEYIFAELGFLKAKSNTKGA